MPQSSPASSARTDQPTIKPPTSRSRANRVWKACTQCRRKKRKCDGQEVCRGCRIHNKPCIYPETVDNAATNRQQGAILESQTQHMTQMCQQLDTLVGRFNNTMFSFERIMAERAGCASSSSTLDALGQASLGEGIAQCHLEHSASVSGGEHLQEPVSITKETPQSDQVINDDEDDDAPRPSNEDRFRRPPGSLAVGELAEDSYGSVRYVGGVSNMVMIDILKNPAQQEADGSPVSPTSTRKGVSGHPFFIPGRKWGPLPFLPEPKQLSLPPTYMSDLLVGVYFDQLHYSLPLLDKNRFTKQYRELVTGGAQTKADVRFLAVFYAVCACASSLVMKERSPQASFPGIEHYEKATLMQLRTSGEACVEQVQSLALLAYCTAGWNTLSQAWKYAGQAVRAAQDLGFHQGSPGGKPTDTDEEISNRIWWSCYVLDRVLSMCLGRPLALNDRDCTCELPAGVNDEDLDAYFSAAAPPSEVTEKVSPVAGFIVICKLSQLLGEVGNLVSMLHIHRLVPSQRTLFRIHSIMQNLGGSLPAWVQRSSDSVHYSVQHTSCGIDLTLCVVASILHSGALMILHWPLATTNRFESEASFEASRLQCISAAQNCIQVAAMVRDHVPPSHYLAFCIHHLALSGIVLLRLSKTPQHSEFINEVESCIRILSDLEPIWSGALRSKEIIQELYRKMSSSSSPSMSVTYDISHERDNTGLYSNVYGFEDSRILNNWFEGQLDFTSSEELLRDLFP